MKNYLTAFFTLLLIFRFSENFAQPILQLSVTNQTVVGTDFYFDIMMQTTSGATYFSGADLVLTFNSENFANPVVSKGEPGSFVLNNSLGDYTTHTKSNISAHYDSLISPAVITSNEIIINVNIPAFSNQDEFNSDVAKIDNNPAKFGTYKVSGITNPAGNMGLAWKTSGTGVTTIVMTYDNASPWSQSQDSILTPLITDKALPVELISFTSGINGNSVELKWATATEVNNYGFEVERASTGSATGTGSAPDWEKIGFVQGAGNSNSPKEYIFVDANPITGKLQYRLKQIDIDGNYKYYPIITELKFNLTNVKQKQIPKEFILEQNYPNPFNPTTKISFSIPRESFVRITIFDELGQEITTIVNEQKRIGNYEINFKADNLTSGIYFYQLKTDDIILTKKMLLIR